MASLRDKLRAAAPAAAAPKRPAPTDCYCLSARFPAPVFNLPDPLPGAVLSLIDGEPHGDVTLDRVLFLDTETTGLSGGAGTVAFEVGVGYFENGDMIVEQYVMRDYDEEGLLLGRVAERMRDKDLLCTFNGKTFDMPLLASRFTMQRMRPGPPPPHLDLLHASRRVWKLRLGRCNLTALEEAVLGDTRQDDLPGALVPQRFFDYLKTGDFSLLDDVLRHNQQDVVSLAHILSRLMGLHENPLACPIPEDVLSLGRVMERRGRGETARACYRAADQGSVSLLARARLADSLKRAGQYAQAREVYQAMVDSRQGGLAPCVALAKLCEHRLSDVDAALAVTRQAMLEALERQDALLPQLQKRYQRLLRKSRRTR